MTAFNTAFDAAKKSHEDAIVAAGGTVPAPDTNTGTIGGNTGGSTGGNTGGGTTPPPAPQPAPAPAPEPAPEPPLRDASFQQGANGGGGCFYYGSHQVGWGGTSISAGSMDALGVPWSAIISGDTVTYYVCE